jgi:hypothetical protein
MSAVDEPHLTLYCDPGETFGWCIGKGTKLLLAGQTPMWDMADEVEWLLKNGSIEGTQFEDPVWWRDDLDPADYFGVPVGRIVCENFRLYPTKAKALIGDEFRTVRVIGALQDKCRPARYDIPFITQGANIKDAAQKAGEEELYYRPLHENRHQNDAIQHFVFFTNTVLRKRNLVKPEGFGFKKSETDL